MNYDILNALWTEKYRPKTLDDIVLSKSTRNLIEKFKKDGIIPNLFLCSSPGQGKTSLAKLLAYEIFECDTLYLNCSDRNNVDTVRDTIKNYAETLSSNGKFKIIILDEADGFANEQSQRILRALMEEVSDNTRFIITANSRGRVLEALRSRCLELDINPTIEDVIKRCVNILNAENVNYNSKQQLLGLSNLIKFHFPDIRSIIKHLQASVDANNNLNIKDVTLNLNFINEIFDIIRSKTNKIELRKKVIENEELFNHNYQGLLVDFYHHIINRNELSEAERASWTITISEYVYRSANSVDPELNAISCFYSLMQ